MVGFRDTAFLFGGSNKNEPRPDATRVWQLSEDASKWTLYPQHLKTGRKFFRSLVQANTIIHIANVTLVVKEIKSLSSGNGMATKKNLIFQNQPI